MTFHVLFTLQKMPDKNEVNIFLLYLKADDRINNVNKCDLQIFFLQL